MSGLPRPAKASLEKARDCALLAIEVYNKPAVKFRSGGYITLMVMAWTSLFHAVFFRRKQKPYYKLPNGRFQKIDDELRHWELGECLVHYFGTETSNPIRNNLEFFILLRNKIVHRSMPELDASIFGECQAMLLNFDEMLEKEFDPKLCLRESLSFALQLFPSSQNLVDAVKHNPDTKPVVAFVQQFRSTISADVTASSKFSFKAFLIQVANHKSENALAVQFVNYDKLTPEQQKEVSRVVAFVKFKDVPVSNLDVMKPGEVVKKVQIGLGNPKVIRGGKEVPKFNLDAHTRCWRKFDVRPPNGAVNPQETNSKYCTYDKLHGDYGFTQAWVDFLIEKLKDSEVFEALYDEA